MIRGQERLSLGRGSAGRNNNNKDVNIRENVDQVGSILFKQYL